MSRITTIFIFTAVVLFNLSSGAQASDWNMWGKDAGHTFFTTDSGQIIWTHQSSLDFPSFSISGNILYIAGFQENQKKEMIRYR